MPRGVWVGHKPLSLTSFRSAVFRLSLPAPLSLATAEAACPTRVFGKVISEFRLRMFVTVKSSEKMATGAAHEALVMLVI